MATKTISIDMVAYDRLRKARLRPDESFSQVIRRGRWDAAPSTGAALLRALKNTPLLDKPTLNRLERAQKADEPPDDAWSE